MSRLRVAIYGAGVGGLSAAHELCKRPDVFDVHVYEASDRVGGKAASQFVTGTGFEGRGDLPGEHGFRFFPAFYAHLDKTMAEIPTRDGGCALDRLIGSDDFAIARNHSAPSVARRRLGTGLQSVAGIADGLHAWFAQDALDLSAADFGNFAYAMTKFLMSSERRRATHYDRLSWCEFTDCSSAVVTEEYRTLLEALPRTLVAMDGWNGSAYTIGKVAAQLFFFDPVRPDASVDRVLDGPTSDVWLADWQAHLVRNGVEFHFGEPLAQLEVAKRGKEYVVDSGSLSSGKRVFADYHICALPVERLAAVVDDDLADACGELRSVRDDLAGSTNWMVGAQYFLRRDIRVCSGHVLYPDSPWALTSISQNQFWSTEEGELCERFGDGRLGGILSVDISNWDAVAPRLGRTARQCTRDEILDEVFRQVADGLNSDGTTVVERGDVIARHLDDNIRFDDATGRVAFNKTPLFVHHPGMFRHRPSPKTGLRNLMLAADFVATHTNLASMEGANEAARSAVGHVVRSCAGSGRVRPSSVPFTRTLQEPVAFMPFKRFDAWLMDRGLGFAETLDGSAKELAELACEADRVANHALVERMQRRLDLPSPRRAAARVGVRPKRVRETLGQLRGSLSRAQRLASRRSVSIPRRRRVPRSPVRNVVQPPIRASKSPPA